MTQQHNMIYHATALAQAQCCYTPMCFISKSLIVSLRVVMQAVNCLLTAYALSVLHSDGVKFGDT